MHPYTPIPLVSLLEALVALLIFVVIVVLIIRFASPKPSRMIRKICLILYSFTILASIAYFIAYVESYKLIVSVLPMVDLVCKDNHAVIMVDLPQVFGLIALVDAYKYREAIRVKK